MLPTILKLPHGTAGYIRAFDVLAMAIGRDGRISVSSNPKGARAAFF